MRQTSREIPRGVIDALAVLLKRLDGTPISWAVTGSLGQALQGVPLGVRDIDVQTDEAGAYAIERRLSEYSVRRVSCSSTDAIRSHFGEFKINQVRVEVMGTVQKRLPDGDWEPPVEIELYRTYIHHGGMMVPVLELAYECEAYEKLGRTDRAILLKEHVENLKTSK